VNKVLLYICCPYALCAWDASWRSS